jgi:arylsulfatase A-like enzyme
MTAGATRRGVLAGGLAALAIGAGPELPGEAARRPNVLFILADDLGHADLGCYGQQAFATPVLDALARAGVMLEQCYANSPVCSATRTALITGRYQQRLAVGLFEPVPNTVDEATGLPPGHPTIASLFRGLGYRTSLVGKWHLGRFPGHSPLRHGYEHYLAFESGGSDYFRHAGTTEGVARGLWEDDRPVHRPGYLTDVLADHAIGEIGRALDGGRPFFTSLHFNAPHWPWQGPGDGEVPPGDDPRQWDRGSLAKYAELVTAMDRAIGRVLAAIDARGAREDTLVVFTSDNGGERFSRMWPLTGMKGELLEGGIRVPGIVSWPGRIAPGSRSSQVATSMDWLPTLLAAAGGAPAADTPSDGVDLLPVLCGDAAPVARRLFWRYHAQDQAAVRDGDWKYLRIAGSEFLFDLAADTMERANRKAAEPARFARLKAAYAEWEAQMLPYGDPWRSETPKGRFPERY